MTRKISTLCAVMLSASALAAPVFLTPDNTAPSLLLPKPPTDASPAAVAELAELHRIEMARTPETLARAKYDDKTENTSIFSPIMGEGFDLKALPATARMFATIRADEQAAANAAKLYFKRHRPWIVDASLQSCSKGDAPESSYPSGHATMGYAMGMVLAALAPQQAQAILNRADEYAENRLVCGMHFRRDIEAGHVLGTVVALHLMQNVQFMAQYDAAAAELRAAHVITE
mgnify:CR=1 FL=1